MITFGYIPTLVDCYDRHKHDCWEILYFIEGKGIVIFDKEEINFSPGTVIVIPPDTYHEERSEDGYRTYFVGLAQIELDKTVHVFQDYPTHDILSILEIINNVSIRWPWNAYIWCDSLILALQNALLAQTQAVNQHVKNAIQIISENISNPEFSINEIYKNVFMSQTHLRRLFSAATGLNPTSYLINRRIDYACKLLANPNHPSIKELSAQCGFSNPLQFSKVFKKYKGVSPSSFYLKK